MRIFGLEIGRAKTQKSLVPYSPYMGMVREPFAGAWQKNVQCDTPRNILAFSAVYASVSMISDDISKLRPSVMVEADGIWVPLESNSPFRPVLRKPNRYQTIQQFLSQWMAFKLLHGNAYILKERDSRGIVVALYVLDSRQVTPLVAPDGSIFYQLSKDDITGLDIGMTVPASEIIHDRMITLWHPLVGVSPIYACGSSATQGIRIQANSAAFFENMSRPSGVLTAPATITEPTAERLRRDFEANFGGSNIGRLMIGGDGLKYEPMTIPAVDAQLVEQLRWTVEDVARCFKLPLHKLMSGQNPTFSNVGAMNQDYYSQTLQVPIEAIECLLDDGLALPPGYCVEFDLEGLFRMDPVSQATTLEAGIRAGYLAPNEARKKQNLPPVKGGETPYLQQQNYSLAALAERDKGDPFPKPAPAPIAAPVVEPEPEEEEPTDEEIEQLSMLVGAMMTKELRHAIAA